MLDALILYRYDIIGFVTSTALVVGYHFYLRWRLCHDGAYTIQALNHLARRAWVENVMADSKKDVMAVQTLRNSTMAAIFLASTAVLMIIGVLNLSQMGDKMGLWQGVTRIGATGRELWVVKLVCVLADLFVAFFSFALAVRMYNHVGYLINSPQHLGRYTNSPAYVATLLNRGGRYYSLGMRGYYLAVPLVFWLFGPDLMLVATVGLVTVLYHIDRAPYRAVRAPRHAHLPAAEPSPILEPLAVAEAPWVQTSGTRTPGLSRTVSEISS